MAAILPTDLPSATLPLAENDILIVEQSAGVRKTTPTGVVNAVAPVSTQTEAIAGIQNTSRMTPLRVKESINAEIGGAIVPSTRTITGNNGLDGGGDLSVDRTIGLNSSSTASLALADSAAQGATTFSAGAGLTGGGTLADNRSFALNSTSIASLALADSAVQSGDLADVAFSGLYSDLIDPPVIPQGTVTSVGASVPTGLSVSGSPVTSSGTIAISYAAGYQGYTTVEATKVDNLAAMAFKDDVSISDIDATGTPSSSTFLRGDGLWASGGTSGGQVDSVVEGSGIDVDSTDPTAPIVALNSASVASLVKADAAVPQTYLNARLFDVPGSISPVTGATLFYTIAEVGGVWAPSITQTDAGAATGAISAATLPIRASGGTVRTGAPLVGNDSVNLTYLNTQLATKASTAAVTTTVNGLMIAADKVKLNDIATAATANQTDTYLLNRVNHTGLMPIAAIDPDGATAYVVGRALTTGPTLKLGLASAATASTVPYRGAGGVLQVGTPTTDAHATTKLYVDTADELRVAVAGDSGLGFYKSTMYDMGNVGGTTVNLAEGNSNFRVMYNNGAFTLVAPPAVTAEAYTMFIFVVSAVGNGAMTASGFTSVNGTFAPARRNLLYITVAGSGRWLNIVDGGA